MIPSRTIRLLAAALLLMPLAPALAQDTPASVEERHQTRDAFSRDFAEKVLSILQDSKKSMGDRKDVLRQAFNKSVDIDWIARFVLGHAWSNASAEQRDRYTTLYRRYLTESYVSNFAEDPDKRIRDIKVLAIIDSDGDDNRFRVRTQMMLANMENLTVTYLVQEKDGKRKVLDIAIENVSLIETHRAEFSKLATAQGVDGVISKLEQINVSNPRALVVSMK